MPRCHPTLWRQLFAPVRRWHGVKWFGGEPVHEVAVQADSFRRLIFDFLTATATVSRIGVNKVWMESTSCHDGERTRFAWRSTQLAEKQYVSPYDRCIKFLSKCDEKQIHEIWNALWLWEDKADQSHLHILRCGAHSMRRKWGDKFLPTINSCRQASHLSLIYSLLVLKVQRGPLFAVVRCKFYRARA